MQIIDRKTAIAHNLKTYFTGRPCRNGHIDYRYTASGACKSCLYVPKNKDSDEEIKKLLDQVAELRRQKAADMQVNRDAEREARLERARQAQLEMDQKRQAKELEREQLAIRKQARDQLVKVRFRAFEQDRQTMALAVWAATVLRYPMLTQGDVDPKLIPTDRAAGTALYSFYCHSADIDMLRAVSNALLSARAANGKVAQERAVGIAKQFEAPDTTPPMNFK